LLVKFLMINKKGIFSKMSVGRGLLFESIALSLMNRG